MSTEWLHLSHAEHYMRYMDDMVILGKSKKKLHKMHRAIETWQYDEKEMTVEEYENMALMKSVVEENTSGIVESVTQFQKDAVIDEYTAQLIEEGLI